MAHVGCPVICDRLYSGRSALSLKQFERRTQPEDDRVILGRQALHAHRIGFAHPISGESMKLTAPLAKDIESMLNVLREHRPLP